MFGKRDINFFSLQNFKSVTAILACNLFLFRFIIYLSQIDQHLLQYLHVGMRPLHLK